MPNLKPEDGEPARASYRPTKAEIKGLLADLDQRPPVATRLKSWLARRVAGLIARDPEAARIVTEAGRDQVHKEIASGLDQYDRHLDRTLPGRIREAQRRFG